MPTKHCSFANCTSDNRYPQENVFFIPFVKPHIDEVRCKKWIHATRRTNLTKEKISKYTYVCSKHFIGGKGPTEENPDPVSATISKVPKARKKRPSTFELDPLSNTKQKQEKYENYQAKVFIPIKQDDDKISLSEMLIEPQSDIENSIKEQVFESCIKIEPIELESDTGKSIEEVFESTNNVNSSQTCIKVNIEKSIEEQTSESAANDKSSQTCMEVEGIFIKKLQNEITDLRRKLSMATLNYETTKEDPKKFKFYTGLMPEDFEILWNFFGPPNESSLTNSNSQTELIATIKQSKTLSLKNQLFLTLVRLQCGFVLYDLSCRFGISTSYASKITITWIQLMYHKFKQLDNFPSSTDGKNLPHSFKKFQNIRIIINSVDWSTEKPKNLASREGCKNQ